MFGRKNKARSSSTASPPIQLNFEHDDVAPDSSAVPSLSSTVMSNSEGFYSTPPTYNDSGNCSPLSVSPSTPVKHWELSYKHYLTDVLGDGNQSSDGSQNFVGKLPDIHPQSSNQAGLAQSLPHASFIQPARYRGKSDQGIAYNKGNKPRKSTSYLNTGADSDGSGPRVKIKNPSPPRHLSREVNASTSDEPVHGGKFFSSVFSRKKKPVKILKSDLDKSSKIHSRTKSCGSLDMQMKNGAIVKGGNAPLEPRASLNHPTGTKLIRPKSHLDYYGKKKDSKQRQKKLAFTEHHNSRKYGADNTAPYLGEEKSVQRGSHFAKLKEMQEAKNSLKGTEGLRVSLAPVSEDAHGPRTTLTPVEGTDHWVDGRRYLMAPAIIAMCPADIFSLFDVNDQSDNHMFGEVVMGSAEVAQIVSKGLLKEECEWSSGEFVLRQNYLLEYEDAKKSSSPRGFAFLQNASIRRHDSFANTIRMDFYQNYPDTRKSILFRLTSEPERDRWFSSLSQAARLKVEDLYEYDKSASGQVLGKGSFATVYPGRRRRGKKLLNSSLDETEKKNNGFGILKKKPSFPSFAHLAVHLAEDEFECALKIIDKDLFWKRVRKDRERADSIVRETSVQAALLATGDIYPGFLRVKSFFETFDKVVLEMELLDGIDLFRYIEKKGILSEVEAAQIMYDILSCVDAMKTSGIAHRDIKPANILMADKKKSCAVHVKLGDFGMATFVGEDNLIRGRCGTPGYVAPEIMAAKMNGGYENKVDAFSAGVIMYILLCGYEPFYGESEKELIAENLKAKVDYPSADWGSVSVEGRDLVEKMLERDPSKRIVPSKALQHPWITRRATGRGNPGQEMQNY